MMQHMAGKFYPCVLIPQYNICDLAAGLIQL